jgi:hypothetical protein
LLGEPAEVELAHCRVVDDLRLPQRLEPRFGEHGTVDGQTISSSGGKIDVDVLSAGTHTVTITSTDKAGNVTIKSVSFTFHATIQGLINAINDGASRGAGSPLPTPRR